jgi:hypothetical protein
MFRNLEALAVRACRMRKLLTSRTLEQSRMMLRVTRGNSINSTAATDVLAGTNRPQHRDAATIQRWIADVHLLFELSRFVDWRRLLTIEKTDTLLRWHRKDLRLFWRWKSGGQGASDSSDAMNALLCVLQALLPAAFLAHGVMFQFSGDPKDHAACS